MLSIASISRLQPSSGSLRNPISFQFADQFFFLPWAFSEQRPSLSLQDLSAQSLNQMVEESLQALERTEREIELAAFQVPCDCYITTSRAITGGTMEANVKKRLQQAISTSLAAGIGNWENRTSRQVHKANTRAILRLRTPDVWQRLIAHCAGSVGRPIGEITIGQPRKCFFQ
jgi:hypothetical protein